MDFQTSDGVRLNYRIQGQSSSSMVSVATSKFGVSRYPSCWRTVTRW